MSSEGHRSDAVAFFVPRETRCRERLMTAHDDRMVLPRRGVGGLCTRSGLAGIRPSLEPDKDGLHGDGPPRRGVGEILAVGHGGPHFQKSGSRPGNKEVVHGAPAKSIKTGRAYVDERSAYPGARWITAVRWNGGGVGFFSQIRGRERWKPKLRPCTGFTPIVSTELKADG